MTESVSSHASSVRVSRGQYLADLSEMRTDSRHALAANIHMWLESTMPCIPDDGEWSEQEAGSIDIGIMLGTCTDEGRAFAAISASLPLNGLKVVIEGTLRRVLVALGEEASWQAPSDVRPRTRNRKHR